MNGPPTAPVVCFPFVGDRIGGSHVSAVKLIRRIDRWRFQPLVILHQPEGPLADWLRAEGVPFEPAPSEGVLGSGSRLADAAFLLGETRRLARFLRRRGVRIVHTNDGRIHATWALPAKLAGAKLLWHHRKDPQDRGVRFLAPWVADRLVSVSQFAAPRPGLLSAARRCTVVPSPFDTEPPAVDRSASRRVLIEELGCGPKTRVVGIFGSLVRRKRPLVFVDTIAELRARAPDLGVVGAIFGHDVEGFTDAVRQGAEARGVAERVRLMGFRYPPEAWMAACDVLLVPAVNEPFGRTLIEAMLLGTVVVAAASGGNLEAIRDGETGFLAPPDDPGALAERTLAVLRDEALRTALTDAARRDAVARFGLDRHATAIMDIYDAMIGAGRVARVPELRAGVAD